MNTSRENIYLYIIIILIFGLGFSVGFMISGSSVEQTQSPVQNVKVFSDTDDQETEKTNINTATQAELEILPGIGPELAKKIIENRPYTHKKQLLDINGIGEKTMLNLYDIVEVE